MELEEVLPLPLTRPTYAWGGVKGNCPWSPIDMSFLFTLTVALTESFSPQVTVSTPFEKFQVKLMDEPTTPNTSLPSYIWMNFIRPYIKVIQDNLQVKLMFLKQFKVVCTYQLSYTNLLKNNLKLYSLMIEVFGEHLILYYEKVTCRKQLQRLKQFWASTIAWMKPILLFQNYFDLRLQGSQYTWWNFSL